MPAHNCSKLQVNIETLSRAKEQDFPKSLIQDPESRIQYPASLGFRHYPSPQPPEVGGRYQGYYRAPGSMRESVCSHVVL